MSSESERDGDVLDCQPTIISSSQQQQQQQQDRSPAILVQNMSYRVKTTTGMLCKKKTTETTLLTGVSAKFCYGEFVALMGGSGCGKSTLLDLLALRKDESGVEGKIWFEGQRRANLESQHAVYLMQSDISMENLTVFETLKFAAQFRLPEDTPNDELEAIVNQLLRELRPN